MHMHMSGVTEHKSVLWSGLHSRRLEVARRLEVTFSEDACEEDDDDAAFPERNGIEMSKVHFCH